MCACAPYGIYVAQDPVASVLDSQVVGLSSAGTSTPMLNSGIYTYQPAAGVAVRRNLVRQADPGVYNGETSGFRITGDTLRNSRRNDIWIIDQVDHPGAVVRDNLIRGYPDEGLWIDEGSSILIDGNDVAGAGSPDCKDDASGGDPAAPHHGTLNIWTNDTGLAGDPAGICTP